MNYSVSEILGLCQWDTASFLIISKNVFGPLVYYSHLTSFIVCILMGLFILMKSRKLLYGEALAGTLLLLATWLFLDLITWATEKPEFTMFFWSIINMVEPLIYGGLLFFLYTFIHKKAPSFGSIFACLVLLAPIIIATPTNLALTGFNLTNCDREATEGVMVYYGYFIEMVFSLSALIVGIKAFFKSNSREDKSKILLATMGCVFLLLSFSVGNVIGSLFVDWTIGQYGLFGIPVFAGILMYLIVKYRAFDIKLLSTQAIVVILWILLSSILFIRRIENVRVVVIPTLVFFIFLGYQLVRSVKKEVESKERLQKLSSDLQTSNTRLKELDTQKTEFLSFATHQIRSPLASMKGYASLILEGDVGEISVATRKTTETILASANTLANVVEGYLNITRIELGTMKYDMKEVDFAHLVTEVAKEQKVNIEERGLTCSVSIEPGHTYTIKADIDKFKQVIMNIVDNSVKYTPKGSIALTLERDAERKIIRLIVSDTGVGIAPEVMPKLFRKFSRASNASEVNIHGTGLGLFIAKEIVTAHGGRMWAESEGEGKGSRFVVEMREGR
jgi:signal transduction histidine kinase